MDKDFNKTNSILNKRSIALLLFRYSKLLTIIFLLFIFGLSYLFIISPKYVKMQKSSDRMASVKIDELQKLGIYLERLKNFNKSFKDVSVLDKERMEKIIPQENDYEDLIVLVEDIVNKRGLVLNSISIESVEVVPTRRGSKTKEEEAELPENIKKVGFTATISGVNYKIIKDVISDFEKSLRLMDIQDVSFSEGSSLVLEVNSYYFKL